MTVAGRFADELAGIAASTGIVEGRARVLDDPDGQDIEEGEILVCRSTDPSWAVLFSLAAGLVIDIGSPLSHGAILARELGLPCVINTRHATTQIRTGDRIRVDGTNGTVTVLDRLSAGI
jgi:pyruvate,water dikinase